MLKPGLHSFRLATRLLLAGKCGLSRAIGINEKSRDNACATADIIEIVP